MNHSEATQSPVQEPSEVGGGGGNIMFEQSGTK